MKTKQAEFTLSAKDRAELEKIVGDGNAAQKVAKRAKIVLMTAAGAGVMAIMRTVSVSKTTVWRWQEYFVEAGVAGVIKGRSKPPGKKPIAEALKRAIVEKTVKERPAHATHWSVRIMGDEVSISHTSVQRIWKEYGLKPHVVRTFKVSNAPHFTEKMKGCRRLLSQSARKSFGAFRRREKPNPSPRSHAARFAPQEGARRHHDARL